MASKLGLVEPSADVTTNGVEMQLIAPAPEHCPGPESQEAGRGDQCQQCPNQEICSSAPKGPDPDIPLITKRLASVRHKILILSGKGGVGKSTFTALLAHAFAARPGHAVGVMDIDICGPSIPKMMGVERDTIHITSTGWSPVWVSDSLCVTSIQFMLPNQDDAVIWRGAKKNGLIKQFLKNVDWQDVDLLLIDTPPGTSDEHLSVNALLKESGVDGAVLLTTPQEVSLLDVRKQVDFCRKAGIKLLGLVENMSHFVCPKCAHDNQIFSATTGGGRGLAQEMAIPFLGSIPLDPRIGMACDYVREFHRFFPGQPGIQSLGGRRRPAGSYTEPGRSITTSITGWFNALNFVACFSAVAATDTIVSTYPTLFISMWPASPISRRPSPEISNDTLARNGRIAQSSWLRHGLSLHIEGMRIQAAPEGAILKDNAICYSGRTRMFLMRIH